METGLLVGLASLLSANCSPTGPDHPEDAVVIGGLLPSSGGDFDPYGANEHHFIQQWRIDGGAFVDFARAAVRCPA
ncbi:hypothetical protein WMF31_11135 [Sorangium sp. So ce1036]|uniref:hypothetical protein n=1 Tax=Sorangium sp. So ce1036 TaxID=3133328 RepID=UPI003EFF3181